MANQRIRVLIVSVCAVGTSIVAAMVLIGWKIHSSVLMSVVPGYITMKPNTALAFLGCGIALLLTVVNRRALAAWPAIFAGALGFLTLLEYASRGMGIDELIFRDPYSRQFPGRMAHISAANFVVLSFGLVLLSRGKRGASQSCFGIVGLSSWFAVLGYVYGVPVLYGSIRYTSMALHTGAGFCLLATGSLVASSDGGPLAIVWMKRASSHLVRRLLPASVLIPAFVGFVALRNPYWYIDPRLAAALIVLLNTVLFSALVLGSSVTVLSLESEKESAEKLSQIDALTGTLNRRGLENVLDHELMRWKRFGTTFSVVMIDIDHFKSINDKHGHLMGDAVLQSLTSEWRKSIRAVDYIGRFGGEEFVVLLLAAGLQDAFRVAEKLREVSANTTILKFGFEVTVSCGVSMVTKSIATQTQLIQAADAAVYQAKLGGRNRTVLADSSIAT